MNTLRFSEILKNFENEENSLVKEKALIKEMHRLDDLGKPWDIVIDCEIEKGSDFLIDASLFSPSYHVSSCCSFIGNDISQNLGYEELTEIHVENMPGFLSENGCLLDKDGNLIFAPKQKRTSLPLDKIKGFDNHGGKGWNEYISPYLRDGLFEYYRNPGYGKSLSKLCLLAKDSMVKNIFLYILSTFNINPGKVSLPVKEICFSDEIFTRKYGVNSPENFPWDRLKQLNKEQNIEKYSLQFRDFETTVFGNYDREKERITLYTKAMKETGLGRKELGDLFLSVFAHELFHAFEAFMMEKDGKKKWDGADHPALYESMAGAFEYYFLMDVLENDKMAEKLSQSWEEHNILIYPYSGAKVMVHSSPGMEGIMKFSDLFHWLNQEKWSHWEYEREVFNLDFVNHGGIEKMIRYLAMSLGSPEVAEGDLLWEAI